MTKCIGPLGAIVLLLFSPIGNAQDIEEDRNLEHAHGALRCFWIGQIAIVMGLNLMEKGLVTKSNVMIFSDISTILGTSAGIALRNHYALIGQPMDKPERDAIFEVILWAERESIVEEFLSRGLGIIEEETIVGCANIARFGQSLIDAEIRSRSQN